MGVTLTLCLLPAGKSEESDTDALKFRNDVNRISTRQFLCNHLHAARMYEDTVQEDAESGRHVGINQALFRLQ